MKSTHLLHTGPIGQYSSSETVYLRFWILLASSKSLTPMHELLNFSGLLTGHKVAGEQPIRIQHLGSWPLFVQSAVEKPPLLVQASNPEQLSNSCIALVRVLRI